MSVEPQRFFGVLIDSHSLEGQSLALLLAVLLGGMIGLERELSGQAAGLRTHILVCVGSTLMTLVSAAIVIRPDGTMAGDPARIAAQIVTGIGFLGAGAIVREGLTIHGLTTAASIWTTSGIGIALGAGPRIGQVAVTATLIVIGTLWILDHVEDWLKLKQRIRHLHVTLHDSGDLTTKIIQSLAKANVVLLDFHMEEEAEVESGVRIRHLRLYVRLPGELSQQEVGKLLGDQEGVIRFEVR